MPNPEEFNELLKDIWDRRKIINLVYYDKELEKCY